MRQRARIGGANKPTRRLQRCGSGERRRSLRPCGERLKRGPAGKHADQNFDNERGFARADASFSIKKAS